MDEHVGGEEPQEGFAPLVHHARLGQDSRRVPARWPPSRPWIVLRPHRLGPEGSEEQNVMEPDDVLEDSLAWSDSAQGEGASQ